MNKKAISEKIKNFDSKQLQELLKQIKLYRDLSKQLWNRGKDAFNKWLKGEKTFIVEYFSEVWEDLAWEQAKIVYEKVFSHKPSKKEVSLEKKDSIGWGIKVYLDDSLIDLSFSKIKGQIIK